MPIVLDPFRFVLVAIAGWMNQRQLQMIEYLREDNRVLREQLGERRLRLTDDQRRRLAAKAKGVGRNDRNFEPVDIGSSESPQSEAHIQRLGISAERMNAR